MIEAISFLPVDLQSELELNVENNGYFPIWTAGEVILV